MNLRNITERTTSSVVALVGIAGVVTVLIGVLSIAAGFRAVLDQSGQEDVAIVLRNGATDEMGSSLVNAQTRIIADAQRSGARRRRPDRFARAVRRRRRAADAHRRRRRTCRCAASARRRRSCGKNFQHRRRPRLHARHVRSDRRTRRERAVRRAHRRQRVRWGTTEWTRRRHLRGRRQRLGIGDLDRRIGPAGRLQPRQLLSVDARQARRAPARSRRSRTR